MWLGTDERMVERVLAGAIWDVRFAINLRLARLMHCALGLAADSRLPAKCLFPTSSSLGTFLSLPTLTFYNKLVAAPDVPAAEVLRLHAASRNLEDVEAGRPPSPRRSSCWPASPSCRAWGGRGRRW